MHSCEQGIDSSQHSESRIRSNQSPDPPGVPVLVSHPLVYLASIRKSEASRLPAPTPQYKNPFPNCTTISLNLET